MQDKKYPISEDQRDLINTIVEFSKRSRVEYGHTKEWTALPGSSCETIRVPVSLLIRIKELGESFDVVE